MNDFFVSYNRKRKMIQNEEEAAGRGGGGGGGGGGGEVGETSSRGGVRFTGIRYRKWGRWGAEIRLCRTRRKIWLGSYDTPQEAAMAYDAALYCLRGPNSRFNFPDSCNRISSSIASASFSSSSSFSDRPCMTANEIKNFSRQYALQQQRTAATEPPCSSCNRPLDDEYAAASAAAVIAASPELENQLWHVHENVAWFGAQMHDAQQHFNYENDNTDDEHQSRHQYCIDSIWTD